MKILEIFSGTQSVGKVAREMGWEVVSMDICPKYNPTFCCDIMTFDYTIWPSGWFDVVHCSPPCTLYSLANPNRRPEEGNAVTRRMMDFLNHLKPQYTIIENPVSSLIWRQGIIPDDLHKNKVSYCMYGFNYRKNTYIATNIVFKPKICKGECGAIVEVDGGRRFHLEVAKRGRSMNTPPGIQSGSHTQDELFRIPAGLVRDILSQVVEA
jgi:hypothetical protein